MSEVQPPKIQGDEPNYPWKPEEEKKDNIFKTLLSMIEFKVEISLGAIIILAYMGGMTFIGAKAIENNREMLGNIFNSTLVSVNEGENAIVSGIVLGELIKGNLQLLEQVESCFPRDIVVQ